MKNENLKAPLVGDVVLYVEPMDSNNDWDKRKIHQNGFSPEPAIVTAEFSYNNPEVVNPLINVRVIPDGTGTAWRTSIQHLSESIKWNNPTMMFWCRKEEYKEAMEFLNKNIESIKKLKNSDTNIS